MAETDVFSIPADQKFYQADLAYDGGMVTIAAEPHGSVGVPTITLDVSNMPLRSDKPGEAVLFLTAAEALEIWTALGHAIRNASGQEPKPVALIEDREGQP